MVTAVAEVAAISFPNSTLKKCTPLMAKLEPKLDRMFFSSELYPPEGSASDAEYSLLITDFTTLITSLVPQLARLGCRLSLPSGACSSSTRAAENDLFRGLWRFLLAACTAHSLAIKVRFNVMPFQLQPFHSPLYTAFDSLLTWLLVMSQSPAWMAMSQPHAIRSRNSELLIILEQPTVCLKNLCLAFTPDLHSHLEALPVSFLPALCCIVSEQLISIPTTAPHTISKGNMQATFYKQGLAIINPAVQPAVHELFNDLLLIMSNLTGNSERVSHPAKFAFLEAPSVMHLLKLLLIRCAGKTFKASDTMHKIMTLKALIKVELKKPQTWGTTPPRGRCTESNCSTTGVTFNLHHLSSRPAVKVDALLLHALSIHMQNNTGLSVECLDLQSLIILGWRLAQGGSFAPAPCTEALLLRSVIGLASQCSGGALRQLRNMWSNRLGPHQPTQLCRANTVLQVTNDEDLRQQSVQLLQVSGIQPAHPREGMLDEFQQAVLERCRALMHNVSTFQLWTVSGGPSAASGEQA